MTVRPMQDRVLIRRVQSAGNAGIAAGTVIADIAQQRPTEGDVVDAGRGGRYATGFLRALAIRAGDRVLFESGAGAEVRHKGESLVSMKEADIVGVYRATAKKQAA